MMVRPLKLSARSSNTHAKARMPEVSDDAIARRFARTWCDQVRFVGTWGRWMIYDGTCWRQDDVGAHLERVRETCEAVADNRLDDVDAARARGVKIALVETVNVSPKVATVLRSRQTIQSVAFLARHDPQIAVGHEAFDRDPHILVTPDGTFDLRNAECRPNSPNDMVTMAASVSPDFDASCDGFIRFLDEVTGGDVDRVTFLRRFLGYCCTGLTTEHAMAFLHGPGGNGKTTLIEIVAALLGTYAATAPADMLMASELPQHSTDLAGLVGKRMVACMETEDGRRWAEAKLKTITGGDRVRARYMRQDFFEFTPQFKLIVASNSRPRIGAGGASMRRRLRLVPFDQKLEIVDRNLRQRLIDTEGGAIMAWLIRAAAEWFAHGLGEPASVRDATDEYFSDEDRVQRWIDAECEVSSEEPGQLKDLHASFKLFEEQLGVRRIMDARKLAEQLRGKGFPVQQHSRTRLMIVVGLRVRPV